MPVVITGNNTPTAGGVTYGDGTTYANTAAGSAGGVLYSAGASAPAFSAAGTSGQLLQSNGASAPSWATVSAGFTLGTRVTTTSGTTVSFTGIPAGVKQVILSLQGVSSSSGTETYGVALGTSSGEITTGYDQTLMSFRDAGASARVSSIDTSFAVASQVDSQARRMQGQVILTLQNSSNNTWTAASTTIATTEIGFVGGGSVTITNALTTLRFFTISGGNFDAGSVNIMYI